MGITLIRLSIKIYEQIIDKTIRTAIAITPIRALASLEKKEYIRRQIHRK